MKLDIEDVKGLFNDYGFLLLPILVIILLVYLINKFIEKIGDLFIQIIKL